LTDGPCEQRMGMAFPRAPDAYTRVWQPIAAGSGHPLRRTNRCRTGKRRLVRNLTVADPAGVLTIYSALMTRDARTFVFTYVRTLSDLYLVSGVR
jgi:hypothetical protein